jgi:ribulose-phosphate 3-epimerase
MESWLMIKIAPSVLSADFSRLSEQLQSVESGGADLIHVDVMDGHFVSNITFGPIIVSAIRKLTRLPLCVHLMISEPWRYASAFCDAGADYLSFHWEVFSESAIVGESYAAEGPVAKGPLARKPERAPHERRPEEIKGVRGDLIESTINLIKEKNVKPGLALNPETSASGVLPFLSKLDLVLVMSVHPGFGGQGFIKEVLPKIKEISRRRSGHKFEIEVDGGVSLETAPAIVEAGATMLAVGSYVFCAQDPASQIKALRRAVAGIGDES